MADFCRQCSIKHFGKDFRDFKGISTSERVAEGYYALVLCEGCGPIQVDEMGICISVDCLEKHGAPTPISVCPKTYRYIGGETDQRLVIDKLYWGWELPDNKIEIIVVSDNIIKLELDDEVIEEHDYAEEQVIYSMDSFVISLSKEEDDEAA